MKTTHILDTECDIASFVYPEDYPVDLDKFIRNQFQESNEKSDYNNSVFQSNQEKIIQKGSYLLLRNIQTSKLKMIITHRSTLNFMRLLR